MISLDALYSLLLEVKKNQEEIKEFFHIGTEGQKEPVRLAYIKEKARIDILRMGERIKKQRRS